jgi:dihydrofolate synthase/folylpolyglutamate synthase
MEEQIDENRLSDALSFLYDRIDYERNTAVPARSQGLHLDRMRDLLQRLGNPHHRLNVVHVAGTKGKGSTASMIASVLVQSEFRVGLYTSPHLQRLEERFVVNGQRCTQQQLVDLIEHVRPAIVELDRQRAANDFGLTFFEITTAMAMIHFDREAVNIAVLEVGMGGRLDSTNVCQPLVSVITNISLDHTRQLGNTLESIATEKAGIIKPNVPVVSGVVPAEPRQVIARVAATLNSQLFSLDRDFHFDFTPPVTTDSQEMPHGSLIYSEKNLAAAGSTGQDRRLNLAPGLLGRHQAANAAVAVATIGRLQSLGWTIPVEAIALGIAGAECPARIEIVAKHPWVVLDTAHNTASIEALIAVLNESFIAQRRVLIFAATRDKDALGMLRLLRPQFDAIILTRYHDNPRSVLPTDLLKLVTALDEEAATDPSSVSIFNDPVSAWQACRAMVDADSLVCVTGSFFLAAEIRDTLCGAGPGIDLSSPQS